MENKSIKNIIENYKYIKEQNIVDNIDLQKMMFSTVIDDNDVNKIIEVLVKGYEQEHQLPGYSYILDKDSNYINKLEIRDFLLSQLEQGYIKDYNYGVKQLELFEKENIEVIEEVNKKNNLEDYSLLYPHYNPLLKNRNYNKYFIGMSNSLFKLLNSMNNNWYKKISNGDEKVLKFIDSLNTIKLWDNLDSKLREERLRNEIIGKLLYVSSKYIIDLFNKNVDEELYINSNDFYLTLKDIKIDNDTLEEATNIEFTDKLILNKVIELYPYSFDMLRKEVKLQDENIEEEVIKTAIDNGYYFIREEYKYLNEKYNINDYIKISNYVYYNYNDLTIKRFNFKDRLNYINKTIGYYNTYLKDKNEEYLFKYLRNIDCYIRNINYLDKDIDKYMIRSKELFDISDNYTFKDRISYINKLIDKYKGITLNLTLGSFLVDKLPISTNEMKTKNYDDLYLLSEMYLHLQEDYKVEINELNNTLSSSKETKYRQQIIEFFNNNKEKVLSNTLEDSEELDSILTYLSIISYKYLEDKQDELIIDLKKEKSSIINILYNICLLDEDVQYLMNLYCKEYKIFKTVGDIE